MTMTTELPPGAASTDIAAARGMKPSWDGSAYLLFGIVIILALLTFQDYGVTWDEDVHTWYGVFVLNYYVSGFTDLRSLHWLDLYNYGAVFDATAAALNLVSPFGTYETRHLLNALVGVVGLVGTWELGRSLGGPRAGFLAALFLALTPNYYGQMFNNPKDVPFAAGCVWALYYLVEIIPALPRPRPGLVAKLGLACGLTLGVRVGGFLLLAYLGMLLGLFALWRALETRRASVLFSEGIPCLARVFVPAAAIAYPVMLLFWPWAQHGPIANPLSALATFSHQDFPFRTLFAGHYVPATDLPWTYLPVHILLALPELVLLLLAASPFVALWLLRRDFSAIGRDRILTRFMVGFAILFPIGYAIAIKAVLFDGMRHFIFVLPPIAAVAALIADYAWRKAMPPSGRRTVLAALGLYGAVHIGIMARLHPDEYVYYNAFIGGTEGAQGLFKLDYWANSYAEAVHGLDQYLKAEYGADFMDHDFTVAVCGPPGSAAYYFPPNFIYTDDRRNADFFIAFTKDDCDKSLPGTVIYRVERMGTLLSLVLDRRDIVAGERHPGLLAGNN
ncbi:MAG TPA: glycosyltransferase family 39 protein [Stellaceae bacterium]|nr:glycosyltransferase family 39 protein [Stellaceae bacterium]